VALVVIDTDVASMLFRQEPAGSLHNRLTGHELAVTFVTVGEAVYGARHKRWGAQRTAMLEQFYRRGFWLVPAHAQQMRAIARTWGGLRADGERQGFTVPVNDAWVAACCVTLRYPLATLNRKHFEPLAAFGLELL
jgi:predicted nucleic acid-binding protein